MKRVTTIAAACIAAVLLALSVSVSAQDYNWQEKTYLTFSNAVELPGMTLPAGTYRFQIADSPSRDVVQVLSEDGKQVHGQFLFVQAERPEVTGENVVMFREAKEGTTPAIQYWYYPNEKIGKEFIYPKDQAQKIAARTGGTVMTEDGAVSAQASASSTDKAGAVTSWEPAQTTASNDTNAVAGTTGVADNSNSNSQPAPAVAANDSSRIADTATVDDFPAGTEHSPVGTSGNSQSAAVGTSGMQANSSQSSNELPHTASPMELNALLGMLSMAGAAGLRAFRR